MTTDATADGGPDWEPMPTETALDRDSVPGALDRIERGADDWVNEHVDQFDPYRWGEEEGERIYRRKAFNELALNLRAAGNLGYPDANPDLREFVVETTNDERYAGLVRRHPRRFLQYAYATLYAKETAGLHPAVADAVETMLDEGLVTFVDRRPFLALMTWQFCEAYGYRGHGIDPAAALATGGAWREPSPIHAEVPDAYALTHYVMFGRDFGTLSESPLDAVDTSGLGPTVDGLVLRMAAMQNWDVLLELLVTGVLEDVIDPTVVRFGLSCVSALVAERGHVPGTRIGRKQLSAFDQPSDSALRENLETWDGRSFDWATNYHPNLVAGTTARLLRERWLDGRPAEAGTTDLPLVAYHRLGQVLLSLSNYDLVTAARRLEALHGSPVLDRKPEVVRRVVEFLRRQERADGSFGYWPDERKLYGMLDQPEPFEDSLVEETTAACEAALEPF